MKRLALFVFLLFSASALAAPNPTQYTIKVHVASSRLAYFCGEAWQGSSHCLSPQQLSVVIDGKKFELMSGTYQWRDSAKGILQLGDYTAKIVSEEHKSGSEFLLTYEFLLPDNTTRVFSVIGVME